MDQIDEKVMREVQCEAWSRFTELALEQGYRSPAATKQLAAFVVLLLHNHDGVLLVQYLADAIQTAWWMGKLQEERRTEGDNQCD